MKNNTHIIIKSVVILLAVLAILYVSARIGKQNLLRSQSEARDAYSISSDMLISQSSVDETQASTEFFLATADKQQGIYTLENNTSAAVIEYLSQKPTYSLNGDGEQTSLIQEDMKNIQLKSRMSDNDTNTLDLQDLDSGDTHYYFQQTACNGVPVFSSYMNVHVNKDNEIYSIGGALAKSETHCERNLSRSQAENIARDAFKKDTSLDSTFVVQSGESIYSPMLSDEEGLDSYLTQRVELCADNVCRAYFVDLDSGVIRFDVYTSYDAMNRSVSLTNGSSLRTEGSAPVSNAHVNKVYDFLGETYNFYFTNFQRDSYNNNGGVLRAEVANCGSQVTTHWLAGQMEICTSTIGLDVIVHELQHGVTESSGGLVYNGESGALNESLSDIFGATADSGDWEMGEETGIRAIRNLQNPGNHQDPDNVYSQYYYCGNDYNTLVHTNSGVFNKAFYLMSDGGTFPAQNGCTSTGLGRIKAAKIIYKGLTTYIRGNSSASFKDMYNAVNSGCADLHTANSPECQSVKIAMESVGMDKAKGEGCRGSSIGTMTCAGGAAPSQTPSSSPSVSPSASPSVSPSTQPSPSPSVTQTPTNIPTPSPAAKVNAPLLSPWSLPQILAGSVKITQSGSQTTIKATLEAKTLNGFIGNELKNFGEDDAQGRLIGSKVLKTGGFKVENGEITNEFTTTEDVSQYSAYEVYFPATASQPELPYLYADITHQADIEKDKVAMTLKLRFQGIESKPKATEAILVRVGVGGGELKDTVYKQVVFTPIGGGVWSGNAVFDIPEGTRYKVLVKGRNHRQKKYCENTPSEDKAGEYICNVEAISLKKGVNTLDFSKVMQMAGDLNQDGIVNSQDMLFIRNNVGTQNIEKLVIGDVNKDGQINAVDHALTKFTLLSNRRDN